MRWESLRGQNGSFLPTTLTQRIKSIREGSERQRLNFIHIPTAHPYHIAILHLHIVTAGIFIDASDVLDIDDRGAVYAQEILRVKPFFYFADAIIAEVSLVGGDKAGVITIRFNTDDVLNGQVDEAPPGLHKDALGVRLFFLE